RATGREPVDAADPALAVLRIPLDRAEDAFVPRHLRLPTCFRRELLVADTQRQHVARARPFAVLNRLDVAAVAPVSVLSPDTNDQVGPVAHRDVLSLAVDVDLAGRALPRDHQV